MPFSTTARLIAEIAPSFPTRQDATMTPNLLKSLQGLVCALMFTAVLCSPLQAQTSGGWRSYEVYQPKVERGYVIESRLDGLAYNHCPTVMWFQDRWFCAWNGNEVPVEGRPGLQIWMSTSRDGITWSKAFAPFSSADHCTNPFRHSQATQWQPEFIVINGQLWCFFYETSKNQEERGCHFAQLTEPEGKWSIRRLMFNGSAVLEMNGRRFGMIFPSQNPIQLRSGRILVPVVLGGGRSPDAPQKATGFWAAYRHASVLYSDDQGKTWSASLGCTMPGRTFCPWEPTVWEQSDGEVLMVFRNNCNAGFFDEMPRPSQFLIGSRSKDGGETWSVPEYVPIETVCSRMYVAPLDGKGIWNPAVPGDDYTGRLQLMFHNDAPGSKDWTGDRRNLAMFFRRGDGFEFTAGPGFVGTEPSPVYPQHCIHDGALVVTYNQSYSEKRSIRFARITPLPDPGRRYLLPRFDTVPNRQPSICDGFLRLEGRQYVTSRHIPSPKSNRLSLAAWVRWRTYGYLIDTRPNGLTWRIAATMPDRTPRVFFKSDATKPKQLNSTLPLRQDEWIYVGLDLDPGNGAATFYVNDRAEKLDITPIARSSLQGEAARVGWSERVPAFDGDVRFLAMFDEPIGAAGHRYLHDRFAAETGRQLLGGGSSVKATRLLWLDPSDPQFAQQFVVPDNTFQGVRVAAEDGRTVLRFFGEGSAGVDLDENHRSRGDKVQLRFRFKVESGANSVICTAGDADQPARVVASKGQLLLTAGNQQQLCGSLSTGKWADLQITTFAGKTVGQLDNQPPVEVTHAPRGTWIYLGQGYQTGMLTPDDRFLIDVTSVRSQVTPSCLPNIVK
jgi:hypothetical protein